MLWSSADTGFSTNGLLNVTPLTSTWSSDSTNSWSKMNFLFVHLFVQYKTVIKIIYNIRFGSDESLSRTAYLGISIPSLSKIA